MSGSAVRKPLWLLSLLLAIVAVFSLARLVGTRWRPPTPKGNGETAPTTPGRPPAHWYQWATLPDDLKASGFSLVESPEPHALMFVHRDSASWLEVPKPGAFADDERQLRNTLRARLGDPVDKAPSSGDDQRRIWAGGGDEYIGAERCRECHESRFDSYQHTPHYRTSGLATRTSVLGPLDEEHHGMMTQSPDLSFRFVAEDDDRIFQEVRFRELVKRIPMDLAIGSGVVGQTYLFWDGNALFQDHVSYLSETGSWINSPGYQDGTAWYARKVIPKCLECHATYVDTLSRGVPVYGRQSLVVGISCERCHGPGKRHVEYHHENPSATSGQFVVHPGGLSSEQQNSVCAQCHFGSATPLQAPFAFRPGDDVRDFWSVPEDAASWAGGVHSSNQLARLELSECFLQSDGMVCTDCHDPHVNQRGQLGLFSQKCLACHELAHCGRFPELGRELAENCIDCHMPRREDSRLAIHQPEQTRFPLLRDHWIRVVQPSEREAGDGASVYPH